MFVTSCTYKQLLRECKLHVHYYFIVAFVACEPEGLSSGLEKSETSSLAQSIDYEVESVDGSSWVTEPPNMMEFDHKTPLGSKQCEMQLRYDVKVKVAFKRSLPHDAQKQRSSSS